jgi:photosystem II stability/assembly factor-like uncharacterized protein
MRKITFTLIIIHCLFTIANAQWVEQNSGTNADLYDVRFIDENTGWICCRNGTILKTTNGGTNWTNLNTQMSTWFLKIFSVNQNTTYCVGYFSTIIKSTNGGTNWTVISSSGPDTYTACFFLNEETGWIGSHGFKVLKTTNGGKSFDTTINLGGIIKDIYFKNPLEGVLCGESGCIKKSTNGGSNWYFSNITMYGLYSFCKLSFINSYTGWLFNDYRRVYKTTNFGESWDSITMIPNIPNVIIYTGQFTSENVGYAGGSGQTFFKSTNGGQYWFEQNAPPLGALSMHFVNDSVGWRTGTIGRLYHTTNGGYTVGIRNIGNEISKNYFLSQNYPNPFNPTTKIKFDIPSVRVGQTFLSVILKIYDITGKEIQTLVNESLKPGTYEVTFDGSNLLSGVYFYKLTSESFAETKKMILLK